MSAGLVWYIMPYLSEAALFNERSLTLLLLLLISHWYCYDKTLKCSLRKEGVSLAPDLKWIQLDTVRKELPQELEAACPVASTARRQ